jgi:hypothetical protein
VNRSHLFKGARFFKGACAAILLLFAGLSCDATPKQRAAPSETTSAAPPAPSASETKPPAPPRKALSVADVPPDTEGVARLRHDVEYLASKELGGRATGEEGARLAAEFIGKRFGELGLAPFGDPPEGDPKAARTFFYRFTAAANAKVTPPTLSIHADETGDAGAPEDVDVPATSLKTADGASTGDVTGEIVFVGWGVDAPEWDDYGGVDLTGKIALALRGSPKISNKKPAELYALATFRHKIKVARAHHAAGLIIVSQTDALPLDPFDPKGLGLPAVVIQRSAARGLFPEANVDAAWIAAKPSAPISLAHRTAHVAAHVDSLGKFASDVVGIMKACDDSPSAKEWVVIGAHYDHLGMGGDWRSMTPWLHAIHPGADDNASGTALVMEVARRFSKLPSCPLRNVVFMTFAGEELGLLGSEAWVEDPPIEMTDVVGMVNADMVGRLRKDKLTVEGWKSDPGWKPLFQASSAGLGLELDLSTDDTFDDRSDHASFREAHVPATFLFTGMHEDYHRPSDTADKINADGLERISTLAARVVVELSERGLHQGTASPP